MTKRPRTDAEVLRLVYRPKAPIRAEIQEERVTLLKPLDHPIQNFARRLRLKIPSHRHLQLDEFGSFIWQQLDGKTTVQEVGQRLDKRFGAAAHPLYERLLLFLNHLEVNLKYIERVE